jgi:hypothetical protein
MMTAAQFRQAFTEFGSTATYPDSMITFWLGVAAVLIPQSTWGPPADPYVNPPTMVYDIGVLNYVAHQISLEARAIATTAAGAIPGGTPSGPVSSESVGGVSRSYDADATLLESGGDWNRTTYGVRFLQLARLMGKGPVQIDTCGGNPYGYPWAGPFPFGGPYY